MPEHHGDKSQDATPHRRQQAREEGQVARSQDLASAVELILGLLCLQMLGGGLIDYLGQLAREQLGGAPALSADVDFAVSQWNRTLLSLVRCALPILGLIML